MNKLRIRIWKFIKLSLTEKRLFLEAVLCLFTAKIMLLLLPFKSCLRFLTNRDCINKDCDPEYLQSIKTAVNRANHLAMWKNICLVQSIASRWMLQRRKISSRLSIGVAHNENKELIAHAWIKVGDFEIVDKGQGYKELYFIE